jgi:flagellar assembly factor FliW
MDFKSKLFGEQQIDPDTIITFPEGIPGFEEQKRYKLFHQEDSSIVYWLQCLDDEDVVFSVAQPTHFNINYNFVLTDEEQALLKLTNVDDALLFLILVKDEQIDINKPTIKGSIKSPIIINGAERLGMQKALADIEQSITLTEKNSAIEVTERKSFVNRTGSDENLSRIVMWEGPKTSTSLRTTSRT